MAGEIAEGVRLQPSPQHRRPFAAGGAVLQEPGRVDHPLAERPQEGQEVELGAVGHQERPQVAIDRARAGHHVSPPEGGQRVAGRGPESIIGRLRGEQPVAGQVSIHDRDRRPPIRPASYRSTDPVVASQDARVPGQGVVVDRGVAVVPGAVAEPASQDAEGGTDAPELEVAVARGPRVDLLPALRRQGPVGARVGDRRAGFPAQRPGHEVVAEVDHRPGPVRRPHRGRPSLAAFRPTRPGWPRRSSVRRRRACRPPAPPPSRPRRRATRTPPPPARWSGPGRQPRRPAAGPRRHGQSPRVRLGGTCSTDGASGWPARRRPAGHPAPSRRRRASTSEARTSRTASAAPT